MPDNRFQTRLPEPLAHEVEELEEQHGFNTSEAVRQLVRHGVEHRNAADTADTQPTATGQLAGWALLSVSIAAFSVGSTTAAGAVAAAAAAVFIGTAADHYRGDADGD